MSWTLFFQIFILVMLIGFFVLAALDMLKPKSPQTTVYNQHFTGPKTIDKMPQVGTPPAP